LRRQLRRSLHLNLDLNLDLDLCPALYLKLLLNSFRDSFPTSFSCMSLASSRAKWLVLNLNLYLNLAVSKLRGGYRRGRKGNRGYGLGIREVRMRTGGRRNVCYNTHWGSCLSGNPDPFASRFPEHSVRPSFCTLTPRLWLPTSA